MLLGGWYVLGCSSEAMGKWSGLFNNATGTTCYENLGRVQIHTSHRGQKTPTQVSWKYKRTFCMFFSDSTFRTMNNLRGGMSHVCFDLIPRALRRLKTRCQVDSESFGCMPYKLLKRTEYDWQETCKGRKCNRWKCNINTFISHHKVIMTSQWYHSIDNKSTLWVNNNKHKELLYVLNLTCWTCSLLA